MKIPTEKANDTRDLFIKFRVNQEELEAINKKFGNSGMKSKSDFIRTMIPEGHIVVFSEQELKEIRRLVTNISANVNQIAIRANRTGAVYDDDIDEIREGINKIWQPLNYFQSQLLRLKH